ncbi:RNA-binding S4 domain-containing protein [Pelistega europaea]|uniref:RNA-binding S4 domain-containing protein n=1 Tax=Pelistega europaea TaxID=106147 RepID=A0A7Y4LA98_9BURK|nr:RNA-binding S4 domain-containing protein [Pelistega europaea]NOL49850.1 RNA-binding S4 domain-containing protein [Pelistega europaea]
MSTQKVKFSLDGHEHIALCDLLKLVGVADSGGQAKIIINEGYVLRNGVVETRKTAKIRADEVITLDDIEIYVSK